ncbi:AraC family transcriptional regulator [Paenibacillus sp. FSL H8-0259]|jgi:AraC family transcriptional regulator, arabinose operon regulatory protein|uniref:AraC family transcriptional regulator n=1 Tax=Paenibacillus sp. FSL H8-0259 TaxID=1920423 RepID=UPI00096F7454|nr:AraC family transcriptional regulator [Paenibacillus sp. FSL H8-0259]OMF23966.1 AraC family transcriptional regulator [Paenibacillus sp. FSL H8-0259]
MDHHALLTSYLSNLKVDLLMADYNQCTTQWRDLDYTPDYSKFYYICGGEGWLKIGDKEYYPQPGELILMPEGVKQSYSCISERPFLKYWCHFSAKVGEINLFRILEMSHVCIPENPAAVEAAFKGITGSAQSDAVYAPLLAKSKLLELISYYIMNLRLDEISYKNLGSARKLTAVLDYIAANIEHNITIHDLAEIAHMHPNYFIRLFKQQIGVPPIQYITRQKIEKAKDLLAATSGSVSEIADQLGFGDLFYFSRQFKKHAGLAPTEFRKQETGGVKL